jgi:HB1, ASXL, restriction endonuclease HTH domain
MAAKPSTYLLRRRTMSAKKTTKSQGETVPPKKAKGKAAKAGGEAKPKKPSALDAAAKVLGEKGEPMNYKEMIEAMATKGYWKSPGGETPHATLYSGILKEITTKGKYSRFKKTERGKFSAA